MKISILGVDYEIEYLENVIMDGEAVAGMIDSHEQKIQIKKDLNEEDKPMVVAHEIIHGYFIESGLRSYFGDEILVDWIAAMLKKINVSVDEVLSVRQ